VPSDTLSGDRTGAWNEPLAALIRPKEGKDPMLSNLTRGRTVRGNVARISSWLPVVLALLLAAAPATAAELRSLDADPEDRAVYVTNRSAGNLTVSVVLDGTEYVLGRVSSLQTRRFELPRGRASARAQLLANGITSRSEPIVSSLFHSEMGPFFWQITEGSRRAESRPALEGLTRTSGPTDWLHQELI
jgi:hypothetical protein